MPTNDRTEMVINCLNCSAPIAIRYYLRQGCSHCFKPLVGADVIATIGDREWSARITTVGRPNGAHTVIGLKLKSPRARRGNLKARLDQLRPDKQALELK